MATTQDITVSQLSPLVVPLLIDGKEEISAATFDIISPYTNSPCWAAASASPADAIRAVDAADAAFVTWSQTKPTARRDILLKTADLLESRLEENAAIMRTEMGADVADSQGFVVPLSIRILRDISGRITSICGSSPAVEADGQSAIVYKEPMGVILGIVPWNAPYVFGIRSAACALAAGNTTVLKSSELSPRCYWTIGRAFQDAGLPSGCLNVLSCNPQDAPAVVKAMIEHPAVRKINFTGSSRVGRIVASTCGKNLKPCLMELGGKNSAIVCEDADLKTAINAVLAGAFINSGQICMSTDRIILHSRIAPAFIEGMKDALKHNDDNSALPPTLVNAASKARVAAIVQNALASGAHLMHGSFNETGKTSPVTSIRMPALILGGVKENMTIWQDENFSSVASCMIVENDEEAIRIANTGGYGLSAAVFTEDLRKGLAIARKIQSGAVHINSMTIHDEPVLPHGGVKNSGWGRFNAAEGLNEFLTTKSVTWMD